MCVGPVPAAGNSSQKHRDLTGEERDFSAPQIDCFVVGDAAQSINQFRGGKARNVMQLSNQKERFHPEPDVSTSLTLSFRFGANVALEANRSLLIKKKSLGVVSWTWWDFVQPGDEKIRGCRMFLRLCKEKKHAERCAMRCNQFHRRPDREVDEDFWRLEFAVKCRVPVCGGSWPFCQYLQHTDPAARRNHGQHEEQPLLSQAGTEVGDSSQ